MLQIGDLLGRVLIIDLRVAVGDNVLGNHVGNAAERFVAEITRGIAVHQRDIGDLVGLLHVGGEIRLRDRDHVCIRLRVKDRGGDDRAERHHDDGRKNDRNGDLVEALAVEVKMDRAVDGALFHSVRAVALFQQKGVCKGKDHGNETAPEGGCRGIDRRDREIEIKHGKDHARNNGEDDPSGYAFVFHEITPFKS